MDHPNPEPDSTTLIVDGKTRTVIRTGWRRFVPKFSMRTLMLFVLAVGGSLGWVVHRSKVQREAVAVLHHAGFGVTYRWAWDGRDSIPGLQVPSPWPNWLVDPLGPYFFGEVTEIHSIGTKLEVDDRVMSQIAKFSRLESISLDETPGLTDDRLAYLSGLTRLKSLDLETPNIQGHRLAHLKNLTKLESLMLRSVPLTDSSMAHFAPLVSLEDLYVSKSENLTDAGLIHLRPLIHMRSLSLSDARQITTLGLSAFAGMTDLEGLTLNNGHVDSLDPISHLSQLKKLGLADNRLNDAGLKVLSGFKKLECLELSVPSDYLLDRLGDETLSRLSELKSLTTLDLAGSAITDAGLIHLQGLSRLEKLDLGNTKIGDAGVARLVNLAGLKVLNLGYTRVTDAGMASLSRLNRLECLYLHHTKIKDVGLEPLADLTNCKVIFLRRTKTTPKGIANLKKKLPLMNIY